MVWTRRALAQVVRGSARITGTVAWITGEGDPIAAGRCGLRVTASRRGLCGGRGVFGWQISLSKRQQAGQPGGLGCLVGGQAGRPRGRLRACGIRRCAGHSTLPSCTWKSAGAPPWSRSASNATLIPCIVPAYMVKADIDELLDALRPIAVAAPGPRSKRPGQWRTERLAAGIPAAVTRNRLGRIGSVRHGPNSRCRRGAPSPKARSLSANPYGTTVTARYRTSACGPHDVAVADTPGIGAHALAADAVDSPGALGP